VTVDRLLPTAEAADLIEVVRELAERELRPVAARHERAEIFPREIFRLLGRTGLLGLPYPEDLGGSGQPYEVFLQALEEIAAVWASVAVGVSVHVMTCYPLATRGSAGQQQRWLPEMLGGDLLGGYCLSEADAGSDPAALRTTAVPARGGFMVNGTKAWVTHGSQADYYTVMARTGPDRAAGVSCFLVDAGTAGLSFGVPEQKMGLTGSVTTTVRFDDALLDGDRMIGAAGQGLPIALEALDAGRLGIAAVAVGLAQGALDEAVAYAAQRVTFGRPVIEHQGLAFLLADMEAAVHTSRAAYLDAARRKDAGRPYTRQASIAKLVATDAAMQVTTDAVQVFGGNGYTRDFPVERYMREAKVMQIFEGTNQIQRMVISRHLARGGARPKSPR